MAPISSHTIRSQNGEPTVCAIPAGVRKMPTAITSPTTRAVTAATPRWRVRAVEGGAVMRPRKLAASGEAHKGAR